MWVRFRTRYRRWPWFWKGHDRRGRRGFLAVAGRRRNMVERLSFWRGDGVVNKSLRRMWCCPRGCVNLPAYLVMELFQHTDRAVYVGVEVGPAAQSIEDCASCLSLLGVEGSKGRIQPRKDLPLFLVAEGVRRGQLFHEIGEVGQGGRRWLRHRVGKRWCGWQAQQTATKLSGGAVPFLRVGVVDDLTAQDAPRKRGRRSLQCDG